MAACMWHAKGMKYSAKVRLILRKCQEKYMKLFFFYEKSLNKGCLFRTDEIILGYGVMVTQQILVLFFLVRVRVSQQKKAMQRGVAWLSYFPTL